MRNYVFLGDSPNLETGFGRVTQNIIPFLDLPNKHVWGIGYDGLQHNFDFNLYPANINSSWEGEGNKLRFAQFLDNFEDEIVLWTIHDPHRLANFIDIFDYIRSKKKLTIVSYLPIDSAIGDSEGEFIKRVDVPVAYTEYGANQIKNYTDKNVLIIPHGNDSDFKKREVDRSSLFPNFEGKFIIGNINSNTQRKALHRTLEIFAYLNSVSDDFRLYLHTNPNGFYDIKGIAASLGVLDKVAFADPFFTGVKIGGSNCSKDILIDIYNSLDLFVSTAFGEGWGLTAMEAASCEIPICAPNHTSLGEIFSHESAVMLDTASSSFYSGKLVPDIHSAQSAQKILEAISSGELPNKAINAKKIVDSFNWKYIREEWNQILLNC